MASVFVFQNVLRLNFSVHLAQGRLKYSCLRKDEECPELKKKFLL